MDTRTVNALNRSEKARNMAKGGPVQGETVGTIKAKDRADNVDLHKVLQDKVNNMSNSHLIQYMKDSHKSDVYVLIRDFIPEKRLHEIEHDPKLAPDLKMIRKQAKESWDHDHALATNLDVDRAITVAYKILVKMVKEQQDTINALTDRIDKLEAGHKCDCDCDHEAVPVPDAELKPEPKPEHHHKKGDQDGDTKQGK